jgi:hypothetical protein
VRPEWQVAKPAQSTGTVTNSADTGQISVTTGVSCTVVALLPISESGSLRVLPIRDIDLCSFSDPSTRHPHAPGGQPVKQLIAYLLDHAILDFSGDLTLDTIREFLRGDDSPAARAMLAKLVQEGGVDDMLMTLADCLQEYLRTGLTENVVLDQIKLYSES